LKLNPNPLNPAKRTISLVPIFWHLNSQAGAKIFHPYENIFPLSKLQCIQSLAIELNEDLKWLKNKVPKPKLNFQDS
jgi:hypothetical protein